MTSVSRTLVYIYLILLPVETTRYYALNHAAKIELSKKIMMIFKILVISGLASAPFAETSSILDGEKMSWRKVAEITQYSCWNLMNPGEGFDGYSHESGSTDDFTL